LNGRKKNALKVLDKTITMHLCGDEIAIIGRIIGKIFAPDTFFAGNQTISTSTEVEASVRIIHCEQWRGCSGNELVLSRSAVRYRGGDKIDFPYSARSAFIDVYIAGRVFSVNVNQ
jgi:hypothetical protein